MLPYIEFQFPAAAIRLGDAPQGQGSHFGNLDFQGDRDNAAGLTVQGGFDLGDGLNLTLPILDHIAGAVIMPRGSQKIKFGRLADDQGELPLFETDLAAFLHAEGGDAGTAGMEAAIPI